MARLTGASNFGSSLSPQAPATLATSLLDGDQVANCAVKGFKGLEQVLAVNAFHGEDDADSLLRVGISRATHQLVVVGEPDVLRRLGPVPPT